MSETRRSALTILLGGAAALGTGVVGYGVLCLLGPSGGDADRQFDLSDIAPGAWRRFTLSDRPVAVFHAPDGLRAFYLICTRAGCALELAGDKSSWVCPCDDARFALDGEPISGPIPRNLDRVPVRFDGMVMEAPKPLGRLEPAA